MYFLYKNEYRTFKPVEIIIRRELRKKEEKWRRRTNLGYNVYIYVCVCVCVCIHIYIYIYLYVIVKLPV
jgi:hypothetical protein